MLGLFQLEPLNATVLHGSDVQFHATVQGNWQVMTWFVADLLVLTVPTNGSISSSSEQFSATFCSGGDTSCVEFTIHNATRGESGLIICSVQGDYGSKMAQLYVQGRFMNICQAAVFLASLGIFADGCSPNHPLLKKKVFPYKKYFRSWVYPCSGMAPPRNDIGHSRCHPFVLNYPVVL